MTIYKANKFHSTMTCDTTYILGTDTDKLSIVFDMLKNIIMIDDTDIHDNLMNKAMEYIENNGLIILDDSTYELAIGKLDNDTNVLVDSDSNAYIYQVVNSYTDRF